MNAKHRRARGFAALAALATTAALAVGLAPGIANAHTESLSLCSGSASGFLAKWGPASKQCSYTSPASGWKGHLRVDWSAQSGTNQYGCVEARMGKARNPDKWQGVGCGSSGSGIIAWPANSMSMLEVRAKSLNSGIINVDYSI
jgi:hypothetical protein